MTLVAVIEQLTTRGLQWQLEGGTGMNGVPFCTALVMAPSDEPGHISKAHAMVTRSGVPAPAAEALETAMARVVGALEVWSSGNADR